MHTLPLTGGKVPQKQLERSKEGNDKNNTV